MAATMSRSIKVEQVDSEIRNSKDQNPGLYGSLNLLKKQ